jgi:hypothetical protein
MAQLLVDNNQLFAGLNNSQAAAQELQQRQLTPSASQLAAAASAAVGQVLRETKAFEDVPAAAMPVAAAAHAGERPDGVDTNMHATSNVSNLAASTPQHPAHPHSMHPPTRHTPPHVRPRSMHAPPPVQRSRATWRSRP